MIDSGKDGKKSMETVQENPAVVPSSSSLRQEADRRSGPISASHPDDTTNSNALTINDDKKNDDNNGNNDSAGNDGHLNSSEDDDGDDGQKLPFSKAKCVALVATLTGASFLNVSAIPQNPSYAYYSTRVLTNGRRPCPYRWSSSSSRPSARPSPSPSPACSGWCRPTPSPSAASSCSGAAWPTSAGGGASSCAGRPGWRPSRPRTRSCRARWRLTSSGRCTGW